MVPNHPSTTEPFEERFLPTFDVIRARGSRHASLPSEPKGFHKTAGALSSESKDLASNKATHSGSSEPATLLQRKARKAHREF